MFTQPLEWGRVSQPVASRAGAGAMLTTLLERTAEGDEDAFTRLYDELAPRVFGLVLRIIVNRSLAEETLQDIFLEVWKEAAAFDPARGAAHTWVLTIAHHRAVDQVRTLHHAAAREHRVGVRDLEPGRDVVADRVSDRLAADGVHDALATLTVAQRQVLSLAYFEGRTQTEIATLLDVPLGTVKTRTRDALLRLRRTLDAA